MNISAFTNIHCTWEGNGKSQLACNVPAVSLSSQTLPSFKLILHVHAGEVMITGLASSAGFCPIDQYPNYRSHFVSSLIDNISAAMLGNIVILV